MQRRDKISPCGKYRYYLTCQWEDGPEIVWIMLNPSRATAEVDDPTFKRCLWYSQNWYWKGKWFGKMTLLNLFALRATKPDAIRAATNPVGPDNDKYLRKYSKVDFMVAAWGNKGRNSMRDQDVMKLLNRELYCLGLTKSGCPFHPLYQPKSATPKMFYSPCQI